MLEGDNIPLVLMRERLTAPVWGNSPLRLSISGRDFEWIACHVRPGPLLHRARVDAKSFSDVFLGDHILCIMHMGKMLELGCPFADDRPKRVCKRCGQEHDLRLFANHKRKKETGEKVRYYGWTCRRCKVERAKAKRQEEMKGPDGV